MIIILGVRDMEKNFEARQVQHRLAKSSCTYIQIGIKTDPFRPSLLRTPPLRKCVYSYALGTARCKVNQAIREEPAPTRKNTAQRSQTRSVDTQD